MKHLLRVVKDAADERDHVAAPAMPPATVTSLSMRSKVPYIKDQGPLGSCTAHAGTELLEMLVRNHPSEIPATVNRTTLRFSPLFQYALERIAEGSFSQDAGADSRTIFRVLAKSGCCLETADPYVPGNYLMLPTDALRAQAAQYKIDAYHRILDVNTAKSVLLSGYTFTVGMPVFQQMESDEAAANGLLAMPQGSAIGGHEMHV
ncbi:MAG: hypothetical protein KGK08_14610, partial [Acidobacteriota bacterium]|nr:hypothetical protein [Acidobacteriota bacterium]